MFTDISEAVVSL